MEDALKALLQRVGLGVEQILTRKRFLQWQTADALRLNRADVDLDAAHRQFIDRLYAHLGEFTAPAAILNDPEGVARLKHSQLGYYQRLWSGPYERDYVQDRLLVGLVHQRVGVDLEWYLGAYRLYLSEMLRHLLGDVEQVAVYDSLLKIVFFDMILAIDTYSAAQRHALEDSEARLARARALLVDPASRHEPIARIAARSGFEDPAGFSRRFRARYGWTPRACRAAAR